MKKYTFILMLLGLSPVEAQNLVPNSSFEDYSTCPVGYSNLNEADFWFTPTNGTSDYFNACSAVMPPSGTYFGPQTPRTGDAYAGILAFYYPFQWLYDTREYIEVQLTAPLIPGISYDVQFYVSLGEGASSYGSDGMGALFTVGAAIQNDPMAFPISCCGTPQVSNPLGNVITDVTNWTLISGTFVAAAAYDHLTIGNFLWDAQTTITWVGATQFPVSYYLIDDVCVSPSAGIGCGIALPAELISFEAKCGNNNAVLNWMTASESNNDYFTIEKSTDGVNFEEIGIIGGAGNSTVEKHYRFVDNSPLPEVTYYRLLQTDFNGASKYYEIRSLKCPSLAANLYPNPFEDKMTLRTSEIHSKIDVRVIDVFGKQVYANSFYGQQEISIEFEASAGIYFVSVQASNLNQIFKMIKSK